MGFGGKACDNGASGKDIAAENLEVRFFADNKTLFLGISPIMIPFGIAPVCWFAAVFWINSGLGADASAGRDIGDGD